MLFHDCLSLQTGLACNHRELFHLQTFHTLNALSERADISRETLLEIQKQGFTLVRTDDIEKRRSLTLILGEHGITL